MNQKRLQIGRGERGTFTLPEGVLALATAILGMRGTGKTTTAVVLVEEAIALNHPVVVIDPLDCWWGLRSSLDGKAAGHPVLLFGGTHADLPLEEHDARAIADLLVEHPWPAVLSLRALSKSAQRRFVAAFLEHLYLRKGEPGKRTPLLVVVDEASTFAPQNVHGETARSLGAIEDLVRRGRTSGFGVVLIDQRAASVSKDVLSQVELLVAHRHKGPHDRKALQEWVSAHDPGDRGETFMGTLATLEIGEAWFWFPGRQDIFERVQVRQRTTWDSSGTPDRDDRARARKQTMARPDATVWRQRLEGARPVPEPKKAGKGSAAPAPNPELEAQLTRVRGERDEARSEAAALQGRLNAALRVLDALRETLAAGAPPPEPAAPGPAPRPGAATSRTKPPAPAEELPKVRVRPATPPPTPPDSNGHAPSRRSDGYSRILTALAQCTEPISVEALGLRARLSSSTGSFGQHLAQARREGLVEGTRRALQLTEAGRRQLAHVAPLPTGSALATWWRNELPASTWAILQILLQAEEPLSKDEVGKRAGLSPNTGSFGQHLAKLRRLNLIRGSGDAMTASEELKD